MKKGKEKLNQFINKETRHFIFGKTSDNFFNNQNINLNMNDKWNSANKEKYNSSKDIEKIPFIHSNKKDKIIDMVKSEKKLFLKSEKKFMPKGDGKQLFPSDNVNNKLFEQKKNLFSARDNFKQYKKEEIEDFFSKSVNKSKYDRRGSENYKDPIKLLKGINDNKELYNFKKIFTDDIISKPTSELNNYSNKPQNNFTQSNKNISENKNNQEEINKILELKKELEEKYLEIDELKELLDNKEKIIENLTKDNMIKKEENKKIFSSDLNSIETYNFEIIKYIKKQKPIYKKELIDT